MLLLCDSHLPCPHLLHTQSCKMVVCSINSFCADLWFPSVGIDVFLVNNRSHLKSLSRPRELQLLQEQKPRPTGLQGASPAPRITDAVSGPQKKPALPFKQHWYCWCHHCQRRSARCYLAVAVRKAVTAHCACSVSHLQ